MHSELQGDASVVEELGEKSSEKNDLQGDVSVVEELGEKTPEKKDLEEEEQTGGEKTPEKKDLEEKEQTGGEKTPEKNNLEEEARGEKTPKTPFERRLLFEEMVLGEKGNKDSDLDPPFLSTPFWKGHVEIRGKCTLKERAFWNFIMEGDNDNAEKTTEVIFEGLQLACTREDFKTLNLGEYISSTIVDAWAMHLNFRFHSLNKNKNKFCFTTNVMMGLSLQSMSNRDPNEYVREAAARMDVEFAEEGLSNHDIKNISHLIVPVYFQTHFYLYCLDFENKKLGILDNLDTVLRGNVPLQNKYGGTNDFLKKVIQAYRKMYKKPFKTPFNKLALKLVNMHCADSTNSTDCGIYAMHHMSKYVCVHADGHDCGFPVIGSDSRKKVHMKNKLDTLRVKYLAKLIESPINKKSDVVREDLSNYFAEKTIE
ncbi:sentrin-specific protease 1 [Striga asiatica]|uniref:Sentrin-specific protease 1 n=1 Tax=Striga asiatica TaxID=4170 RepID=A0A5A7QAE9_STRAF|nr:sentrin-specific protease 1 [Striga asiatica]GER42223.1 sentrin-specific protease 1 [Striga asiatica]GER42472.1 sentrin-specific protease 1 [Striga asiatica]